MSWLTDTAAMYARVLRRGVELTARSWTLAFAVVFYGVIVAVADQLAQRMGIVGSFVRTLVITACVSSWLVLIENAVRNGRSDLRELPTSFGTYLGDLITVGFILFGVQLIATLALAPFPLLQIVFALALVVFLNAVPELIYLGRTAAAELIMASYRFIGENWIEWFPANVVLFTAVIGVGTVVPDGPYGMLNAAVTGLVATYAWIVRGLLFLELTTSSRRAREFQRRAAG